MDERNSLPQVASVRYKCKLDRRHLHQFNLLTEVLFGLSDFFSPKQVICDRGWDTFLFDNVHGRPIDEDRTLVSILHLVGAKDSFVAREVQIRFLRLGFVAGLLGANAAGVIALIGSTVFAFGASDFTGGAPLLNWTDLWILLVAPLVTACASAVAADLAARETLRDLV